MKKFLCVLCAIMMFASQTGIAYAAQAPMAAQGKAPAISYNKNARTIQYAFVFDGPSEKNAKFLAEFQKSITVNTAPAYKASFPKELIFTGDWTKAGVKKASDKALASKATMVVSLGYLSSKYYNSLSSKKKFVVTLDQYGLNSLGEGFFNPVKQSANGILAFKAVTNFNKAAILMTESYYNTRSNWSEEAKTLLPGVDVTVVPVKVDDANQILNSIPADVDTVVFTPLFNITAETKKAVINALNEKKIYTYSTVGREDVEAGVLMGSGAIEVDKKLAEATSFSIKGVLAGERKLDAKISYFEDAVLFINQDTADQIGHRVHLRIQDNAVIISNKKAEVYDLSTIFNKLEAQNLDIKRADKLVAAARRSSISAVLKYLPTFSMTLGYQQYNEEYAESAKLLYPEKTGIFKMGIDQILYAPELITNILVKHKKFNFQKAERKVIEQTTGINLALLYVDTLMLENMVKMQEENVKESRENLAIARVREQMGKCGKEEALRWSAQLSKSEQHLIEMKTELKNIKLSINKILSQDPTTQFTLAELTAHDPAFYTSEINLINYVTNAPAIEEFTKLLMEEVYRVSPELAKLKAAIKMKKYEMAMYYQKFVLPSAKLSYTYTSMIDPKYTGNTLDMGLPIPINIPRSNKTNGQFGIFAQWTPIEGGTKIAEIARTKAELDELKLYEQEVKEELERHVRDVVNKAISAYLVIDKKYRAMFASKANYMLVKRAYLEGDKISIAQLTDAQDIYLNSKVEAMNSQYTFFKELLWVQRGICAVNWTKASPEAHQFIQKIKDTLEEKSDIKL